MEAEALVQALVDADVIGAAQLAWRRGADVGSAAFGACDVDDRFALASLTKPLAAVAVLVACDEGALALDDPVRDHAPEAAVEATVRELLAHASGLPADDAAARRVQIAPDSTWSDVAAAYLAVAPTAAPRTRRVYSNAGYAIAAAVLERTTGFAYPDYVQAAVLDPLGMTRTAFGADHAVTVREPGLLGHGEQLFNGDRFRALGLPQSGAYGTAGDYLRLLGAVEGGASALLSDELRGELLTNQCGVLAGGVEGFMEWPTCDWAVGFELRDGKHPHWTGDALSPASATHFGAAGTLCLIDPVADVEAVLLADRGTYGGWMLEPGGWPDICAALVA